MNRFARALAPAAALLLPLLAASLACERANPAYHPLVDGSTTGAGGSRDAGTPDSGAPEPCTGTGNQRSCYTGADATTAGVGACSAGIQTCLDGFWSPCTGEVIPTGEACNGQDDNCNGTADDGLGQFTCGLGACQKTVAACSDATVGACVAAAQPGVDDCDGIDNDCDGAIDEDCASACVRVSQDGDDTGADGSTGNPFRTIQSAIDWASGAAGRPKTVCVAGGRTCDATATYQPANNGTITMASGVSLYGNYESTNWTRCDLGSGGTLAPKVTIAPQTASGILFPVAVTAPTGLDGFRISRSSSGASATATVAAVTVTGAKQVTLSNLLINDTPQVDKSYGIDLSMGAEVLITRCSILGGAATTETTGIHSVGSKPTIRENCATLDPVTGRCTAACAAVANTAVTAAGIRGRLATATTGTSFAVYLESSLPGASVETSTLCANQALEGAALRITGAASQLLVRGNTISASGGAADSHGVWADDCNDDAPWIVANELIEAQGSGRASGVRAVGACHPVLDGNIKISGGGEGTSADARGVSCEANASGQPSLCAVLGNALIQGSGTNHPATAAGVVCLDGSCVRVAENTVTANLGGGLAGVALRATGVMIDRNQISGGCGQQSAAGLVADDAFARVQNNLISGGGCDATTGTTAAGAAVNAGLQVRLGAGSNELDVNSNTIDAAGNAGGCTSAGVDYGLAASGTSPASPRGIFRNNIFLAGACGTSYGFAEDDPAADPRIFQNNDLDPIGHPTGATAAVATALYLDEATTPLVTATAVNDLADTTASANLAVDPMFESYPTDLHLMTGSACVGAATPTGAPATDLDGTPRDPVTPVIGAY